MKGILVLLVLSATLLAQHCAARSVSQSLHLSDRGELFTHVMADYRALIKGALQNAKDYLERSQAEIAGIAEPSQTLSQLNTKITSLLTDINVVLEKPEATGDESEKNFLQMVICFAKTMIFPLEFILQEDAVVLLNRNGLTKFFAEFKNDASNFLDKFDEAIKDYLDNLSETKKINEQYMVEWYEEFHNAPGDARTRFQKAGEFFVKFKPEGDFHL